MDYKILMIYDLHFIDLVIYLFFIFHFCCPNFIIVCNDIFGVQGEAIGKLL